MKRIRVEGMRCNKCKANIENHLTKLDGVSKVSVDLNKKTVHIEGEDFQLPQIIQILKELGYTPRE